MDSVFQCRRSRRLSFDDLLVSHFATNLARFARDFIMAFVPLIFGKDTSRGFRLRKR